MDSRRPELPPAGAAFLAEQVRLGHLDRKETPEGTAWEVTPAGASAAPQVLHDALQQRRDQWIAEVTGLTAPLVRRVRELLSSTAPVGPGGKG